MFEKLILRTIKKDDVIIVNPSQSKVKVINILESTFDSNWLIQYWADIYDIELPNSFKIAVCQFATNPSKNYNYPLLKVCVRKPIRQNQPRLAWKLLRKEYNDRGKQTKSEFYNIYDATETISKAKRFWRK
jgi:hypothetical protein